MIYKCLYDNKTKIYNYKYKIEIKTINDIKIRQVLIY